MATSRIIRMKTNGNSGQNRSSFKIDAPSFKSVDELRMEKERSENQYVPNVEEIESQIRQKRSELDEEERRRRKELEDESKRIIEMAEAGAFERVKIANDEYRNIIDAAKKQSEDIILQSKDEANRLIKEAEDKKVVVDRQAYDEGYNRGLEKAMQEGKDEISRMVERLEKVLSETINKRNEIIESSEEQLINIAILIARKVVKSIAESDRAVILRNVSEALRKIKGRAQVTIRVNIDDMELTTRHKDDFYKMLDNIENVNVLEDPNIERGGCIIETDFGDVDARIVAQLDEIETAIKNIQPIKGF